MRRPPFSREAIESVVDAIAAGLDGEWLLVGGAFAALWSRPDRQTEDVDVVGMRDAADERMRLLEFGVRLGLPPEALNSAADFFVRRVPDWRQQVVQFRSGSRGRVFRPTPTLFLLLKAGRLTDEDLADCVSVIARACADGEAIDVPRVLGAIDALPATDDAALVARRAALRGAIDAAR